MSFSSTTRFLYRFRWPLAVFWLCLFSYSVFLASHLQIRSDFKELLPENFPSVRDLERIAARAPSTGSLIVGIESDDPKASIRFGLALVEKLKAYPPEFISSVDYNVGKTKTFFEDRKHLFMDLADLQEIRDRLKRRIDREKIKKTGLFLDLQTEEEKKAEFSTDDIEQKYKKKGGSYEEYIDGYFFGEGGKLMAMVIKPPGSSTGVEFSRKLVERVRATINELNPPSYHPSMKVGFTGKFLRVLLEYRTIVDDLRSTALLCVSLVALAVFIYFRRLRMVVLMAWAAFNGVAWTFAITQQSIGYLNTQTAFLGSIIVGNGINYSLILMARYLEERRAGCDVLASLTTAVRATFAGTLTSSVTTSVAFVSLVVTGIRGFSHFGFIGGLGMFLCWVATYTVLPVFLSISEEIWPTIRKKLPHESRFSLMNPLASRLPAMARRVARAGSILVFLSVLLVLFYLPHSLEYNFTRLRVQSNSPEVKQADSLNARVKKIFGSTSSPAVLAADRMDQVGPLCREIMRKNDLDAPPTRVVDRCKSIYSQVPEDQDEKMKVLSDIRKIIDKNTLDFLTPIQKEKMREFKSKFVAKKITLDDLPPEFLERFREKNGDMGKLVFVYSTDQASLWKGKNLIRFADIIRKNVLPDGSVVTGSGDSVIFADLLEAIINHGPSAIVLSFFGVCFVVLLIFWETKAMVFIIGTLVCGVLGMGGLMSLFAVKINFFNFIAIPTTFGIGVDYGVNIYQRYKLEGRGSLSHVLRTTGGAVALCSATTIIGYFTLIIAQNQALVSFGWIAILGEVTCLLSALVFIPSFVTWLENTGKRF